MKKLNLGLLVIAATGLLAACSTSAGDAAIIEVKDPVLTEAFIKENINENKNYEGAPNFEFYDVVAPEGCDFQYDSYTASGGLLVLRKDTKYGVYSILANKTIIEPRLMNKPTFRNDPQFGFAMYYQDTNDQYYYALGNGKVICESENEFSVINHSYVTTNDALYLEVTTYTGFDGTTEKYCYSVDKDGVLTKVRDRYEPLDPVYPQGEVAPDQNVINFAGGYISDNRNGTFGVYTKEGKLMRTFMIPNDASWYGVIGNKFSYQRYTQTGNKYELYNKSIDLTNVEAQEEDFKFPAVIHSSRNLVQDGKRSSYAYVNVTEINSNGEAGLSRSLVVDQDFKAHDDITNLNYFAMTKLSNGNYYTSRYTVFGDICTLYNDKFEEIFCSRGLSNVSFDSTNEVFEAINKEGNYVFIDKNGKLMTEIGAYRYFEYMVSENVAALYKDGDYHFYDLSKHKEVELEYSMGETKYVSESVQQDYLIARMETNVEGGVPVGDVKYTLKTFEGKVLKVVDRFDPNESVDTNIFTQRYLDKKVISYGDYGYFDEYDISRVGRFVISMGGGLLKANAIPAPNA